MGRGIPTVLTLQLASGEELITHADRFGAFAVHVDLNLSRDFYIARGAAVYGRSNDNAEYYQVTHIPSAMGLGVHRFSYADAVKFAKACDALPFNFDKVAVSKKKRAALNDLYKMAKRGEL